LLTEKRENQVSEKEKKKKASHKVKTYHKLTSLEQLTRNRQDSFPGTKVM